MKRISNKRLRTGWTAVAMLALVACASNDAAKASRVAQRVEGSCSAGAFTSSVRSSASSFCMNVVDASSNDGASIEQYECAVYGSQIYDFVPTADGQYRIKNTLSGLCIDVGDSSTSGAQLVQHPCRDGAVSQELSLTPASDGSFVLHTGDGAGCLAVASGDIKAAIVSTTCADVPEQRFALSGMPSGACSAAPAAPQGSSNTGGGPTESVPSGSGSTSPSNGPPPPSASPSPSTSPAPSGGSACGDGVADGNHPSGEAPPNCSPPGFKLARVDDLTDNSRGWEFPGGFSYLNSYVGNGNSSIHDGLLDMHAFSGTTGWAQNKNLAQTYGKFLVRMRGDQANNLAEAPLLWPLSENWPSDGEIDFAEDDIGNRQAYGFSHYADGSGHDQNAVSGPEQAHSLSDWHTWGVEWTPSEIRYTVDGTVWATVTDPVAIPHNAMWLGFVQSCMFGACDANMDAHWLVDWVAVYSYAP